MGLLLLFVVVVGEGRDTSPSALAISSAADFTSSKVKAGSPGGTFTPCSLIICAP